MTSYALALEGKPTIKRKNGNRAVGAATSPHALVAGGAQQEAWPAAARGFK
jgi:hypothetical protein